MTEKTVLKLRTPEMAGINFKTATEEDLKGLSEFLSRDDIDSLFTPRLSDPVRGVSIEERVKKKFESGNWVIAKRGDSVVGCMAIVPTSLSKEVPSSELISEGISLNDWKVSEIKELSTVVTDPKLKEEGIKGVGGGILTEVKRNILENGGGSWGLVTDSWIGGDMGGFVDAMNKKARLSETGEDKTVDTLIRVYSDPGKRGKNGPLTVIYGIPVDKKDWDFFLSKQDKINPLRQKYNLFLQEKK